jgi:hypothetical protein
VWVTGSLSAQEVRWDRLISPSLIEVLVSSPERRAASESVEPLGNLDHMVDRRTLYPSIIVFPAEFPAGEYFHTSLLHQHAHAVAHS